LVRKAEVVQQAWDEFWDRQTTRLKRFALNVVRWLGGSVKEFMTLEEVQEALAEARDKLAQAEERNQKAGARGQGQRAAAIRQLQQEIAELEEKEAVMLRIAAIEAGGAAAAAGTTTVAGKKKPGGAAVAEDWRDKTPEQIGAALSDFRSGKISSWELAERAGLSPPGTAEAIAKEQTAMSRGTPETFAPTNFEASLREMAAKMEPIPIKVRGELVWEDGLQDAADEYGGRD
jgi:hypothetical protein